MTFMHWILLALMAVQKSSCSQNLCAVFQPFKVTPENAKYQIGGPFPLHTDDCVHVRPDIVQELIAVQWALSHWNQNPENANYKLAMSASDTCSREKESLSQTLTFLHESGFFSPNECYSSENSRYRTPIGLIMPMMPYGKFALKDMLAAVELPVITYSTSTAQALVDAKIENAFSTVPRIDHYIQAVIKIMKKLNSNRISLIYSDAYVTKISLENQLATFSKSGIIVTEISKLDDVTNEKLAHRDSSHTVVMLISKNDLLEFVSLPKLAATALKKFYITVPVTGEYWTEQEITHFLIHKPSPARFLILQQSGLFENDQFRAYFLDILRNNYPSYALLATYMQQNYNCSLTSSDTRIDCSMLDTMDLLDTYIENRAIESAVLATYSFGALAKAMATDPANPCSKSGPSCVQASSEYLKNRLSYTFGDSDPQAYRGFHLKFGQDNTLGSLKIQGLFIRKDPEFRSDALVNYTVNGEMAIQSDLITWPDGSQISNWCHPWKLECQKQCAEKTYEYDRMWISKPGHLYLMGLFDMRQFDEENASCQDAIDDPRSLAIPASFVYVLETIRQKYPDFNLLPNVELGSILVDTCHDSTIALQSIIASTKEKCILVSDATRMNTTITGSNIVGFASGQKNGRYDSIRMLFDKKGLKKPLIGSTSITNTQPAFADLNLMPDYEIQARVALDFLLKQSWDYISVLLSEHDPESMRGYEAFKRLIESDDRICISDIVYIRSDQRIESVRNTNTPATRVVISFTTAQDTVIFLKTYSYSTPDRSAYIFMGHAHDFDLTDIKSQGILIPKWIASAWGAISIQPRRSVDQDFRTFLASINPKRLPETWFIRFWQDYFQCAISKDAAYKKSCTGDEKLPTEIFGRMSRESYFILALETFIFTLDGMYKQACPDQLGLCEAFYKNRYQEKLMDLLSKTPKIDQQFVIYNYMPEKGNGAFVEIGNWSTSEGLKMTNAWTWYDHDGKPNTSIPVSTCHPPLCRCKLDSNFFKEPIQIPSISEDENSITHRSLSKVLRTSVRKSQSNMLDYSAVTVRRHQWKQHPWTYIFLVVNSLLLLGAISILGLICIKLCYRVVKGNQSLGICLLCGIILMFVSVYFFIFDPCELICRLRYITHTLAYSLCFGVMITKAVQLRNSETVGFNGYVSYWNYWLLLFFIVIVQFALNLQWAIVRDPILISFLVEGQASTTVILHCSWTSEEFLASQIYVVILLSMALFLSLMNRNVKRNYKETRWLMYTSLICAPIWIVWMISYALIPDPFKDTVVVMELITCATVIMCFMFGPKLYILLSYEPVLIEYPAGFKLDLGSNAGESIEKNAEMDARNDFGLNFDTDDALEDGQRSVLSSGSAATKSTSLSHTLSSASSMTTNSDDSLGPVYKAVIRKKSRSKRIKIDPLSSDTTIGSVSPDVVQRRDLVFGETVSSVH